jgi:hypothetical protein
MDYSKWDKIAAAADSDSENELDDQKSGRRSYQQSRTGPVRVTRLDDRSSVRFDSPCCERRAMRPADP